MRSKNNKYQKTNKNPNQDGNAENSVSDSDNEMKSDFENTDSDSDSDSNNGKIKNNLNHDIDSNSESDEEVDGDENVDKNNGTLTIKDSINITDTVKDSDDSNSEMEISKTELDKKFKNDDSSDDDSWTEHPTKLVKTDVDKSQLSDNALYSGASDDENSSNDDNRVKIPVINPLHFIRNKDKRKELFKKMKIEKNKKKRADRKQKKRDGAPRNPGHTIESLREIDQTAVTNLNEEENQELEEELEQDDFANYFAGRYDPKIVITFSDNPNTRTRKFGLELSRIFPNSLVKLRNRSSVKKMCKSCVREGFTDLIIINENRHKPNGILVIHLPSGPTFHFKVSNVKLTKDIRRDHKEITRHRPELVLTNFTTRLGLTVGRMFGALFNHDPEYHGRRVCTFHNQRDFIFFRHHRYEFSKQGKKAKLRELGPRFTLKLRSIQEGTFDSKTGDYSWIIANKRHAMEGRRKFYL